MFQDRDKGLKIHLANTVEELKKFNARRKLKTFILSVVNSSKWYPYDDTNADSFSDFGDDEVSSCGKLYMHLTYILTTIVFRFSRSNNH